MHEVTLDLFSSLTVRSRVTSFYSYAADSLSFGIHCAEYHAPEGAIFVAWDQKACYNEEKRKGAYEI